MTNRSIMLLAGGGHGSVVLDALICSGVRVVGIIDPGKLPGSKIFDVPVVGGDEWLGQSTPDAVLLANGVGAHPDDGLRGRLFDGHKRSGYDFISVRHPSAIVGQEVVLSEGCQLMAGTTIQCRVSIGANVVINTRSSVDHDCVIDAHTFIGPGATLCGGVRVGENVFIGAGAVILPGITIGPNAVVGAGAIVTHDVPGGTLITGNPGTEARSKRA